MRKLGIIVGLLVATATAAWAVPQFFNIQGTLVESGTPVDGARTTTFQFFDTETGGSPLYSETDEVSFSSGVFNVFIGTNVTYGPIPLSVFDGADKYLQLSIGTTDYPRQRIMSVGYAFRAAQAEALAPGATAQFELIDITTITANIITAASSITASAFFGDGSHLSGIASSSSLAGLYVSKDSDTMNGPLTVTGLSISTFSSAEFSDINFNATNAGRLISRHGLGALIGTDPLDSTANFAILAGGSETELFTVGQNREAAFDEHLTIRNSSLTLTGTDSYIVAERYIESDEYIVSKGSINASAFFGDGSHLTGITPGGETSYFAPTKTFGSSVTAVGAIQAGSSMTASAFFGDGSHLTSVIGTDSTKIAKAGDTMTGVLNLTDAALNLTGAAGNVVGQASMTASAFFGDGSHLTGIAPGGETAYFASAKTFGSSITASGAIQAGSSVTASSFFGDGSHLTDVTGTDSTKVAKTGDTMTGALNLSDVALNLTGASGNVIGQASMTASAFFGDGSHLSNVLGTDSTKVARTGDTMSGALNLSNAAVNLTGASGNVIGQASMTASAFFGDGSHLTGIAVGGETSYFAFAKTFGSSVTVSAAIEASSSMTASAFFGDGSHLTNVSGTDSSKVAKTGDTMTGSLNLTNAGVNLTGASGNVVGQASVTASAFFGDGSHLTGIAPGGETSYFASAKTYGSSITAIDAILAGSSVTASAFFGDGSHLTNVNGTDSSKVAKIGDTMTGALNLTNAAVNLSGASGNVIGQASMTASAFFGDGSHLTGVSETAYFTPTKTFGSSVTVQAAILSASSMTASAFFGDGSHLSGLPTLGGDFSVTGDTIAPLTTNATAYYNGNGQGSTYLNAGRYVIDSTHYYDPAYILAEGYGVTGGDGRLQLSSGKSRSGLFVTNPSSITIAGNGVFVNANGASGLEVRGTTNLKGHLNVLGNFSLSGLGSFSGADGINVVYGVTAGTVTASSMTITDTLDVTNSITAGSITTTSSSTASAFFGDGSHLTGIIGETNTYASSKTFTSNVKVVSSVTAGAFFGDGSHLSGVELPPTGATSVRPGPLSVWSGTLTTGVPGSLTTGIVSLMNFPTRIIASHLSYFVAATPTSGTYKICVYSDDGNTKLIDVTSGANNTTGIKTVAISPAVDLPAGNYYILMGWATTTTSTTIEKWASTSLAGFSAGTSPNVVYEGTISKTSGACDSTINPTSITAAVSDSPVIRFDNN